jgi:ABC-type sugar transport system ATPase subunit
VDFEVKTAQVHALAGENGAGKSTLMHILAGVYQPDAGRISFAGEESIQIRNEHHAQQLGMAIVYQERSLFDLLSVAENLFVNSQPLGRARLIDRKRMLESAKRLLVDVQLNVDPRTPAGQLSPAQQQMIEIARALSLDFRLLILDEPTTALTFAETQTLFGIIRNLKASGRSIVYISHRLEEIFEIADQVTVLKDGRLQGAWPVRETSPQELVRSMVGREPLGMGSSATASHPPIPRLTVKNLGDAKLKTISFTAFSGEILGFAGLAGAGRTELMMSIFGARPFARGEIWVDERPARIASPQDAMALGLGYLPEDRKSLGLFLDMNIAGNVAASRLDYFGGRFIRNRKVTESAKHSISRLNIAPPDPLRSVRVLSGGNQQKVLLARWLLRDPAVLIVDEPTRGVDVAGRAEIYHILRELANSGKAIIVVSSDLPELLTISDRILVMREGSLVAELSAASASEERIMSYAATSGPNFH